MIGDENKFSQLAGAKKDVLSALDKTGLAGMVSLDEIEKELVGVETAFKSPLLYVLKIKRTLESY